jgi:predicted AlkP superfamily phosphohydrolase/phosphomutase
VAVLGWYASWPAEPVSGLMVTDHVMRPALERRVHPGEQAAAIDARLDAIRARVDGSSYPYDAARVGAPAERDLLFEELAPELAAADYELLLVYFRSVDEVSHRYWKFWEPEKFADLEPWRSFDAAELAEKSDWIPATYERVDRVVGALSEAAPGANLLVISDHGFRSADHLRLTMDFDALLERLGYLARDGDGIDMRRTLAFTVETVDHLPIKRARIARRGAVEDGHLEPGEAEEVRHRLAADLARARYAGGEPVFEVRQPPPDSAADVEARLLLAGVSRSILVDGRALDGVIEAIEHYSGGHPEDADGVFIAAGPDIDPAADPAGISIHDITPTLLYGLGLPVAADFTGRAWSELFTERLRAARPLVTITSYAAEEDAEALASEADEEILEELHALGYLD